MYQTCEFGIACDPAAALGLLKDKCLDVPLLMRVDESTIDEVLKVLKWRSDTGLSPGVLIPPEVELVGVTGRNGTSTLYSIRMTGTLAVMVACYMGYSEIVLDGLDYVPCSPELLSRYENTPWYKSSRIKDEVFAMFRGRSVPDHWPMEVEVIERVARKYYDSGRGYVVRQRNKGLLSLPVRAKRCVL